MSSTDTPLTVGVVGLGNLGHWHTTCIRAAGAAVIGGVDVSEQARDAYEAAFSIPTFGSLDALLDHGVDVVVIATPNRFHADYAITALDADVHVLVEKPLAHTVEDAERVVAAANASDAYLMVGLDKRFLAPVETVVNARESGLLGNIVHIEANYLRRRGVPGRGSWFTRKDMAGGGALVDIGVHAIDLALYLMDYPDIQEVTGITRTQFGNRDDYTYVDMHGDDHGPGAFDVDDSATAFIRTRDNRTIALDVSWAANRSDNESIIVRGTNAGAEFSLGDETVTFYGVDRANDHQPLPVWTERPNHIQESHEAELTYFFECIRTGTPPQRNTAAQALVVQNIIAAIYKSSETGQSVPLTTLSVGTDPLTYNA